MSQVTYEIIRKLFEIYPIILQIVLFLVLWNVFFRWEKGIWIVAGILAVMNICMGLWLEKPGVIRYTMSAVIVLGYCFCKYQKHLENGGIHTAAVLQFSCVKLFDCRQYLSMYSGEHI